VPKAEIDRVATGGWLQPFALGDSKTAIASTGHGACKLQAEKRLRIARFVAQIFSAITGADQLADFF